MSPASSEDYIANLSRLKPGELALLRSHLGQSLGTSVAAFDLFTGVWWPLRQKSQHAPQREIAWLIAKLFAFAPIQHEKGRHLASQLRLCQPLGTTAPQRFQARFDRLLMTPIEEVESPLVWALKVVASSRMTLDWVALTDDLSTWEERSTRMQWAKQFLNNCDSRTK
jgi:CRISPR type I-E-associated protein CasB/Cse2